MSRTLIVLDEAEEELTDAEEWYEQRRPRLGAEFVEAVRDAIEHRTVAGRLAKLPQEVLKR